MKKTITLLALSLFMITAKAQKLKEADVPSAVKESFKKNYPNAKVEKWEKEGDNYEAEYKMVRVPMDAKGKRTEIEHDVLMDASGNVLETETQIEVTALPKSITEYVNNTMPGKKIKEASEIVLASGVNHYEVEIDDVDYLFDSNGKLLKKEEDKQKDDKH